MAEFITADELLADPEPLDLSITRTSKSELVESVMRVYPRRPTEIEREMCMSAANSARRAQRKRLLDEKSEEHKLLLVDSLEEADPKALRDLWVRGRLLEEAQQLQSLSLEEREVVPEPDGELVSAKRRDDYDDEVEAAEDNRMTRLVRAIESKQRELEAEAALIPDKQLMQNAIPAHIETIVQQTWNNVYTANLIARCTFSDKNYTKPYFKTVSQVEKFRNRYPSAFRRLSDTHRGLLMEMEPTLGF